MLETQLTGAREGVIHEPTAGTGGLIIQYWWELASKQLPWRFKPHTCIFTCWELSDRSIPILLLNMAIRGMMGEVFHGDVLENVAKARYVLLQGKEKSVVYFNFFFLRHPSDAFFHFFFCSFKMNRYICNAKLSTSCKRST